MPDIVSGRRVVVMGVVLAIAAGAANRALAQGSDDAPPSTITLDRMDATTRLGVQVGFNKLDDVSLSDGFIMRFEPYGQFIFPNRTVGIYGALPISHLFDFMQDGDDATGLGNFDVGALFLPFQRSDLILRVGVALPTATDSGVGAIANVYAGYERITDVVLIAPNYTTVRLSGSTVQESGQFFFRGDLGLDLAVDKPAGNNGVFLRANAAVGARVEGVDLAAELANVGSLDGDGDVENRFLHTFALGVRTRGADQFHAGMVFPLDDVARSEVWIVSLGYQRAMR